MRAKAGADLSGTDFGAALGVLYVEASRSAIGYENFLC